MGALFFVVALAARPAAAGVTFPLEVKWSANLEAPPAFPPAFDDTQVYVGLKTNQLAAVQIADGKILWSVECPMSAAPAAGGGFAYVGGDGFVEARWATVGETAWRTAVDGRPLRLSFDTGWLIASTEAGALVAIRGTDGAILWRRDLGSPLSAPPALSGDRLYAALQDGRMLALLLQTGEDVWTQKFVEPASGILPVGDRVFVGARDNQFHSLRAENGDADWEVKTGADILGIPVLDERRVYFIALDNIVRGLDRNSGTMLWKRVLPMRPFTGAILNGDTLIVPGVAAELHAYNARDGKPAGDFVVKGAENEEMLLAAPPHLTPQDLLILVTKGGQVRGVGSRPAAPPGAATPAPAAPGEAPAAGAAPPEDTSGPDAAGATK